MSGPKDILSRVRYLENLVSSLRPGLAGNQKKESEGSTETTSANAPFHNYEGQRTSSQLPQGVTIREESEVDSPGIMIADPVETRWVDATHWQAILDSITELKDCTETFERSGDNMIGGTAAERHAPILFSGVFPTTSKLEILAFLPSRPVVDRLIARFFNEKEPALMILHVPTFYKEYTQFWDNQQEATVAWIGLLFGILCYSAFFYHRVGETLPGSLGDPMQVSRAFMTKAAQCLVLADYTKPGRYKVETLIVYFGAEFMRNSDSQLGITMILGIIVRLAMHMGFHRDSKKYPTVSAFDGEMRRRVWALISQMDHLISFQAGLPRIIPDSQCDTELPHNLLDEDFDKTTKALPASRPSSERTIVSYTITKGKLMSVFGRITEKTYSIRTPEHEVVQLDTSLQEAQASFPPFFRIRPMNMSITDPPDLIMQRYTLELLYQKARCVLHRKYLTLERSNPRYAYSRWACIDAATQILGHQNDIYHEILPGGQLHRDKWFMSSLMTHDFLLAAMILCLEVSCGVNTSQQSDRVHSAIEGQDKLLRSLEVSHHIWSAFSETSVEARKAAKALTVMLQKARRNSPQRETEGISAGFGQEHSLESRNLTDTMSASTLVEQPFDQIGDQNINGGSILSVIEGMMDVPEMFDWDAWDAQVQSSNGELAGNNEAASFEFPWFPSTE